MGCGLTCSERQNGDTNNIVGRMSFLEQSMCYNDLYPIETEHPVAGFVINVAFRLSCTPPIEKIKSTFLHILLPCNRMTAIATGAGTWRASMLSPSYHFVQEELSGGGERQLLNRYEHLITEDLDIKYPLWRVHVLTSKGPSGEESSLVVLRVHHCISDGMHLVRALGPLTQQFLSGEKAPSRPNDIITRARKAWQEQSGRFLLAPYYVSTFFSNLMFNFGSLEADTPFNKSLDERQDGRRFGGARRIILLPRHSLAFIKAVKQSANVSLLAVLLSVFTGALRRYSVAIDPDFEREMKTKALSGDFVCRATIPSLVLPSDPEEDTNLLGNSFGVVSCELALSTHAARDRLMETDNALRNLQPSLMAEVTAWQENNLLSQLPRTQRQWEVLRFISMHSVDFSSVPGPEEQVWMAEEPVQDIIVALPNMLPQLIAITSNGMIHPTFTVESSLISDPELLIDCYLGELQSVAEAFDMRGDPIVGKTVEECLPMSVTDKSKRDVDDEVWFLSPYDLY